jgi:hypothetical protein
MALTGIIIPTHTYPIAALSQPVAIDRERVRS